jgi:hypothetical protein
VALKQSHAELGLEAPHLCREPWLGDPQTLGGTGEAPFLGDRDEITKVAQFHFGLAHAATIDANAAMSAAAASSASSAAT